jgi:hypothetical protein
METATAAPSATSPLPAAVVAPTTPPLSMAAPASTPVAPTTTPAAPPVSALW